MQFDAVSLLFGVLLLPVIILSLPKIFGLPRFIREVQLYGKAMQGTSVLRFTQLLLVPKRWFTHFYVLATAYASVLLYQLLRTLVFGKSPSEWVSSYLTTVTNVNTNVNDNCLPRLMAAILFFLQVSRRLYECLFVSKFSSAKMNIVHYAVGLLHYWGCVTAVAATFPELSTKGAVGRSRLGFPSPLEIFAVLTTLWAFYHQHKSHQILASLRTEKSRNEYKIPNGGWFECVSCPHYLAEIIIYLSLYILLDFSSTWFIIVCWVIANQVSAARMSHEWYRERFSNYPKKRYAIIPYLI